MGSVFYTSDTHFNHDFVAQTRDFDTAEEHDELLIERFNKVLTKRSQLWILGDLFMGSITNGLPKVARLNGIKHLVLGNHDSAHPMHKKSHTQQRRFYEVFESVHAHEQHVIGGQKVLLSHLPYGSRTSYVAAGPEWRPTGYLGYYANRDGQIRGKFGRVLKPWLSGSERSYETVSVMDGARILHKTVHVLVCTAFHGPKPSDKHQVAHNDGNSFNNRASNLRWTLAKDNIADKKIHGTNWHPAYSRRGEQNPKAKLTARDAEFIRESGERVVALAAAFRVSTSTIRDIKSGRSWNNNVEAVHADHADREDRYTQWRLPDEGLPLLHGHVHKEWKFNGRQFNVGVDHNPTPVPVDTVAEWLATLD